MIVDDRPSNIEALESLLERKDRILLKATSGSEALKKALNEEIDLVILDVQMPSMDGFEVAQILKTNSRTSDIPIIFASAEKKEHKFMMKGFEEGAVDYLHKPLDPEITKAKVSVLLKLQLQKKELIQKNVSLERAALLINNSADIIGIIDAATMKFEEVNNAFTTILGYDHDEACGTLVSYFLSNEHRATIESIRTQNKERVAFETAVYCKDRSIKWLQWNVVVKDGKWFVNARDITLVKQVEKIRNYLATIVQQSSDAIYIHDDSGKIISWNEGASKIYGYSEEDALQMKVWNIIPEYLHAETQTIIEKVMNGSEVKAFETKRITKGGKLIDVHFSASGLIDTEHNRYSVAITERNITQQKIDAEKILQLNSNLKMNVKRLEDVNKELESFSYSVSHDLRAPLRALNGYTRIFEEEYADKLDARARETLNTIQRNAKKMDQLIEDLLQFSRLGKQEVKKGEIDMHALVKNVLNDISASFPHKANVVVKPLPAARADLSLISQVWINLITNAIKYSAKKQQSCIEIGCFHEEEEIIYYIKDNGAGFDMKYANKLFGVFQRLHNSQEFEGTGIGLAIIQRVITRHGGRVWAEGKVNHGATFYFTLPVK